MEISTLGWLGLILILVTTTFGFYWFLLITVGVLVFLFGFFALLYVTQGDIEKCYSNCAGNPLICDLDVSGGIRDVITQMQSPKKVQKTDNRVTGSDLIDSSLQEILGYIIRDYVSPWYSLISRDTEFTDVTVKKTAQTFAINISNRIKDVDWIPYLTQRMVDDAATHLRLFKQSRAKIKPSKPKSTKNSPMREKSPKKLTHKRNKSEPESTWYLKTPNDLKKDDRSVDTKINSKNSLEENFFILECQMENNLICRDSVCMDTEKEKEFLGEIVELLLYILLPDEDFQCKPLRYAIREIFSNAVVLPLLTLLSDPDYINQTIIWLCLREKSLPSEIFLTTLRLTYSCDELKSTKDLVSREIQLLRSRDSGGESDLAIKQQLSSLFYVMKLIDSRLAKLDDFEDPDNPNPIEDYQLESIKKIDLTLDQILKNNIALSYFIDYVSSHGKQAELFFYLNVEGWKVSVEQQLSDLHLNKVKGISENAGAVYENIRSTASSIYDQYLSEKSEQNVQLKPSLTQSLYFKLRNLNETPSELWFDEVRQAVYVKMETHEDFLPAFRRSKVYIKLLQELDLVQQNVTEEDNVSLSSVENLELSSDMKATIDSISIPSKSSDFLQVKSAQRNGKHSRSFSDVAVLSSKLEEDKDSNQSDGDETIDGKLDEKQLRSSDYSLAVDIIETGIVCEKGKTFGIYAIKVSRQYDTGFLEEWHIYRRYSDFHDLYTKVKEKFPDLSKIPFPGKKTFHNMDRAVLERRMKMLGIYMNELCQANIANSHHGLKSLLMTFLEQGDYDRATGGPISNTIDTIVNPLKSGMKTIKNMPEQLFNTVDEVVGGLSKVFNTKSVKVPETCKVGASIEESDDNIPFRIMLLLMDEVFDLKSRNQWLRRRIVTILRQIVRTMFGDIVNRKILDYVSVATSPKNVAHYLHVFKQSFWPNGVKCDRKVERDVDTKNRTRIAAKVALLSCLSDELKHIIGSETTRRGLLTVFELFQRPILNRRLLYVMLEGILCTLFPEKDMTKIFQKLHSKSKLINQSKPESQVR